MKIVSLHDLGKILIFHTVKVDFRSMALDEVDNFAVSCSGEHGIVGFVLLQVFVMKLVEVVNCHD